MLTVRQINQVLEESSSLKLVAEAYSEIAAIKLQKIRRGIERNRNFFQEVSQVFRMVKVAADKRNIKASTAKKGVISLLITSNHRFYGSLENRLTQFFIVNTTKFPTDRVIIGKTAQEYLQSIRYSHNFKPIQFSEDTPNFDELQNLVSSLTGYQQILVYYSRMQSVLAQEPHVVDLLQHPPEHYLTSAQHAFDCIFEPELPTMLQFFDSQITTLLLEQTILESELARTAARLISMEQAQNNADGLINQQRKMLFQAKRALFNNQLLDTIATLRSLRKDTYASS